MAAVRMAGRALAALHHCLEIKQWEAPGTGVAITPPQTFGQCDSVHATQDSGSFWPLTVLCQEKMARLTLKFSNHCLSSHTR